MVASSPGLAACPGVSAPAPQWCPASRKIPQAAPNPGAPRAVPKTRVWGQGQGDKRQLLSTWATSHSHHRAGRHGQGLCPPSNRHCPGCTQPGPMCILPIPPPLDSLPLFSPRMISRVPPGLGTALPHTRRSLLPFLTSSFTRCPCFCSPLQPEGHAWPTQTLQGCPSGSSPHLRPSLCPRLLVPCRHTGLLPFQPLLSPFPLPKHPPQTTAFGLTPWLPANATFQSTAF